MKIRRFCPVLLALVLGVSLSSSAVDGTFYPNGQWCDHNWSAPRAWYNDTPAGEGGVATINATDFSGSYIGTKQNDLTQDVEGLQLRGIEFNNLAAAFIGETLTMVTPYPFFSSLQTTTGANIALEVKGTGDNSLAKIGAGRITVDTPMSNFASVEVFNGTLVNTNALDGVAVFVDGNIPLVVRTGTVLYAPVNAEGGAASATVANLKSAKGRGVLKIAKGSNSSATLTATAFTPQDGGVLELQASDLGGTEKFVVTGKESSSPDGRVIAANGNKINFLAYDADNGYVSGIDADTGDLSELPANVKVYGKSTDAASTSQTVSDTLDFTEAEGFIWRPAATAGATTLNFRGTLTAPQGVTFASKRSTGNRPTIDISGAFNEYKPGWTFPVRLMGVYLKQLRSDTLGPGSELWVEGNVGNTASSAYFDIAYQNTGGGEEYKADGNKIVNHPHVYDLHVSGNGSGEGAIRHVNSGWENSVWQHTGKVFLEDDAVVTGGNNGVLEFRGPIAGRGGLKLASAYMNLYGTNSFVGTLELANSTKVNVRNSGTLGAGDVKLGSNAYLYFTDHEAMTVTNRIDGANGRGAIQNSSIAFDGDTSFKEIFVQQNGNLQIGATLSAQSAQLDGNATISATANDGTFALGVDNATTNRIAATMTDGTLGGKLSFTKQGANTVEVYGHNTYSGQTTVKAGTLRFASDMWTIPDLAYWCDASDQTTMTIEDGKVKEWRSKVGDFKFVDAGQTIKSVRTSYPSISENTYNGHSALRFVGAQGSVNVFERLKGNKSVTQRTIFVVAYTMKSLSSDAGNGLFGEAGQDRITRTSTTGNTSVSATDSGSVATSAGYGYENGVKKTSLETNCAQGGPNVIDLLRPRDVLGGYYNMYSTFVPGIAGCNSDGRNWGGDFCEIIAFSRTLTDAERCTVENYLMKKWNPTNLASKLHSDAECSIPKAENPLPTTTVLEIHTGATLDLNGINQTVKKLQGEGTIFNSSTNAAILTVTEGGDFHGTVKGNITVVRTGSAEPGKTDALSLLIRDGGTFIAGGNVTTTLSPYNPAPVTDGLAVWLDAKDEATITCDDDGNITNWYSKVEGTTFRSFGPASNGQAPSGTYEPTGFNGKPSVRLAGGTAALFSKKSSIWEETGTIRTIFLVTKHNYVSAHTDWRYTFGPAWKDAGIRNTVKSGESSVSMSMFGRASLAHFGDTLRVNGVDYSNSRSESESVSLPGARYCYVLRINDAHAANYTENYKDVTWVLGSYSGSVGADQNVAELICYENALSDYELLLVENYLMEKWIRSGSEWPTEETSAFDSSCGLGVTGGAKLDFGGADLELKYLSGNSGEFINIGSLTLTDSLMIYVQNGGIYPINVAGNLTIGENCRVQVNGIADLNRARGTYQCLSVAGDVTGDFAGVDGINKWIWSKDAVNKIWSLTSRGSLILIR